MQNELAAVVRRASKSEGDTKAMVVAVAYVLSQQLGIEIPENIQSEAWMVLLVLVGIWWVVRSRFVKLHQRVDNIERDVLAAVDRRLGVYERQQRGSDS